MTQAEMADRWSMWQRYEEGPVRLAEAVRGLTAEELNWRPRPGKWSIREITAHLADTELVYTHRMRKLAAEKGGTLTVFDQDAWVSGLFAETMPVEVAVDLVAATRRYQAHLLRRIDDRVWETAGTHETDGPVRLWDLFVKVTEHLEHHVRQIEERRAMLRDGR